MALLETRASDIAGVHISDEITQFDSVPATVDPTPTPRRFHGWQVVWVGALILIIGSAGRGLPQVFRFAFQDAPAAIHGISVFALVYGILVGLLPSLAMPWAGWAIDRWGARRLILLGFVVLGTGAVLSFAKQVVVVWYLSLALVAVGSVLGAQLPVAAAVNNWFRKRRASAMAVLMLPLVAMSVAIDPLRSLTGFWTAASSWEASLAVAATVVILAWPLSRLIKNRPEDLGQHPDGTVPDSQGSGQTVQSDAGAALMPDYTWREALRTRAFWLLVVGAIVVSVSYSGTFYNAAMLHEQGFAAAHHGALLWLRGVCSLAFMLVGGWLGDRYAIRRVLFVFGLVEAIAVGVLAFTQTLPMFYLAAALAGIGAGGGWPLAFAANGVYFGRRNFATITGISLMILSLPGGSTGGLLLVGWLQDTSGGYTLPLAIIALISAVGAMAFLFLGKPSLAPSQVRQVEALDLANRT